jgi:hypothetical protein
MGAKVEILNIVKVAFLATFFVGFVFTAVGLTVYILSPFMLYFFIFSLPSYLFKPSLLSLAVLVVMQLILSREVKILKKDKKALFLFLVTFIFWFLWFFLSSYQQMGIIDALSLSTLGTLIGILLILDSFQFTFLALKIFFLLSCFAFKSKYVREIRETGYQIFSFQKLIQKPLSTIFQSFLLVVGMLIGAFFVLLWLFIFVDILSILPLSEIALYVYKTLNDSLGTQIASFVSFLILLSYLKIVQYLIIKVGKFRVVENEEEEEIEISL